jgi:transcription antitermination factor NusG
MSLESNSGYPWFALTVKHHHEKCVCQALEGRGLEPYLPLYQNLHRSGGRMKTDLVPLFPGYVFCSFDIEHRLPVLTIPSVGSIVSIGRTPAPIPPSELHGIDAMIRSGLVVSPHPNLFAGQEVYIARGPLEGVCGRLLACKTAYRLVVSVSLLQRSVSAEVDIDWVRPLRSATAA